MIEASDETRIDLPASGYSGRRFAVVLVSWLPAGVGVLSSVMFAGGALLSARSSALDALSLVPLFAWVALAVMSLRWVQGRDCHWVWPILGTLCGIVSALIFIWVFYFYVSAIPLAIYLAFWHLEHRVRGDRVA
jgi:hypothetical protein